MKKWRTLRHSCEPEVFSDGENVYSRLETGIAWQLLRGGIVGVYLTVVAHLILQTAPGWFRLNRPLFTAKRL